MKSDGAFCITNRIDAAAQEAAKSIYMKIMTTDVPVKARS
jgi:hypothetical protein